MLLRRLVDYANERMDRPPTLYTAAPVRYIIELNRSGYLRNPSITDTADPSSRENRRGIPRLVPQIKRTSGIKALLLADKADYVLGFVGKDGKPKDVARRAAAFRQLVD